MQEIGPDAAETQVSRSFLFVPADSDRKLARAADAGADALILDLEDAVTPAARPAARANISEFLAHHDGRDVWVRINSLDTADALDDLRAERITSYVRRSLGPSFLFDSLEHLC